jgi:hypothetical protein
MYDKPLTGGQLEQALRDDKLGAAAVPLTGMVKKAEKIGHIAFTRAGCDTWVDIPVEMIEHAEHVGQQTCKDHTHPIMRLTLKTSDNPEQQILMALLAQVPAGTAMPPSMVGLPGTSTGFPGYPGRTFRPGAAQLGGGGLGDGLRPVGVPRAMQSVALGCTACVPTGYWDRQGNAGERTCAYLVCTTIGNFNHCQVIVETEWCSNNPLNKIVEWFW